MVKKKRQVFKWIDCFGRMRESMTHVVTEACVGHKYQDCVAVCPVEAFRETDTYLVIDPDECIDCAACVPECPVEAIFADTDLPDEHEEWLQRNEDEAPDLPIAEGDSPVLGD
uniref:Ferredoxin n=1 Tax=uncultured Poseidoniia archaeon TaxID=1697135 RepID=A0A1B1TDG1_9ARCH|nr:4Fe-4S ferredoxin, iron-sulfur binding protein (fdxA) [uncultured Candidatus Thalassoarchaea sp.]